MTIDPRERALVFQFDGSDALYRDHLGRRVIADAEGSGSYSSGCSEVEVDGKPRGPDEGEFLKSVLVAAPKDGSATATVYWGRSAPELDQVIARPHKTVDLPWMGAGWLLRAPSPLEIDDKSEAAPCGSPRLPIPFFRSISGSGRVDIVEARTSCSLVDAFSIDDLEALQTRQFAVQNISKLSTLESTYANGAAFESQVASHLNRATWRLTLPEPSEGLILRKRYDRFHGRQRARVFVDGAFAGWWYLPQEDRKNRWAVEDFGIPAEFVAGKDSIQITVDPPAGTPLWSVSQVQVFSLRNT